MVRLRFSLPIALLAVLVCAQAGANADPAHRIILPENRTAYYTTEPIEIAVTNLSADSICRLQLVPPSTSGLSPVAFPIAGFGTATYSLPPLTLAPATYRVGLNDVDTGIKLVISSGVSRSTMAIATPGYDAPDGAATVDAGRTLASGLLDADGMPARDPIGERSPMDDYFNANIAGNTQTMVRSYWDNAIESPPWGSNKSLAAEDEYDTMRMLSLHAGQRLRRFAPNIAAIGAIDRPVLAPGKSKVGALQHGVMNWDETAWYSSRGIAYTDSPGSLSDADWRKYMAIRTDILRQNLAWAKQDIKTVWPTAPFLSNLPQAEWTADGADPISQEVNDFPSVQVGSELGVGMLGAIGEVEIEKSGDPIAQAAVSVNGDMRVGDGPATRSAANRLMLGSLLAAGLHSVTWSVADNSGAAPAPLQAELPYEPLVRYGAMFQNFTPRWSDVAVLWSSTEAAMRQKAVAMRDEAQAGSGTTAQGERTGPGNPPDIAEFIQSSESYDVGENYRETILDIHQALSRAGYAAQIVHEKLLSRGVLNNYKVLVIAGQTSTLPPDVMKAIADFVASGGKVIVDQSTTVPFQKAIVSNVKLIDPYLRWALPKRMLYNDLGYLAPNADNKVRSQYGTYAFWEQPGRDAVAPMLAAMRQTDAIPIFDSSAIDLAGERQVGGEGQLYMVLNGFDPLPSIDKHSEYSVANYAAYTASFTLHGITPGSIVYEISGNDWKQVDFVADFQSRRSETFDAGESKLYLVAPRKPTGLGLAANAGDGAITVSCLLGGIRMPWPIEVSVSDPTGKMLYDVYRSLDKNGSYHEVYPLGSNSPAGSYKVTVKSPVGAYNEHADVVLGASSGANGHSVRPIASLIAGPVRVFGEPSVRTYLASRPSFVIAYGDSSTDQLAHKLAVALALHGIHAVAQPEAQVFTRARYPRVWDPYIDVIEPGPVTASSTVDPNAVKLTVETAPDSMQTVATTSDGRDLGDDWARPLTLATVGASGYIDFEREQFYDAGVQLYVDNSGVPQLLDGVSTPVRATATNKLKWSRPWSKLVAHANGHSLPPQLPEAYSSDENLILLGNSGQGKLNAALQASELLPQVADTDYPGPGKALISLAWSPFALGKNAIMIASSDDEGLQSGIDALLNLTK